MRKSLEILIADDDVEDRMIIIEALRNSRLKNKIQEVGDGEELLQYLRNQGEFEDENKYPTPCLILLDLNMPKIDGREALEAIRKDDKLKRIPIVILTTSEAEEDILRTYDIGVNSFITKPACFDDLVEIMITLNKYWFEIVELP